MLSARERTEGWVTVMVFPNTSAVTTRAEKTTVRTPVVPDPFAKSITLLYEFPFESAQETAPAAGSIAKLTSSVWPKTTPPAGTVTESDVPVVLLSLMPTFLTKAIAASAWGAFAIWTAAPRRMARSGPPRRVGTRLDLAMVSSDLTVVLLPIPLAGACRPQHAARQRRLSAEWGRHLSNVPIRRSAASGADHAAAAVVPESGYLQTRVRPWALKAQDGAGATLNSASPH